MQASMAAVYAPPGICVFAVRKLRICRKNVRKIVKKKKKGKNNKISGVALPFIIIYEV